MAQENRISVAISDADKQSIKQKMIEIKQMLNPLLTLSLTATERQELSKMGDKSLAFVGKALDYANQNVALVPQYLDIAEAQKDFKLVSDLKELSHELSTLVQTLDDHMMIAGAEAYDAARLFHASVKSASRSNVPGSKVIYEDLVQRFPRGGRNTKEAPAA